MATTNLDPSSTVSNNWGLHPAESAVSAHGVLSDSDASTSIQTAAQSKTAIVEVDNFSLPAGNVITSVRHYISGYVQDTRGDDTDVQVKLQNSSGTDLYSENHNLQFNSYVAQDHYGTARTTSDGSSSWTESDINGLRLNINTSPEDPPNSCSAAVVKAYIEVTYTEVTGYGNSVMGVASGNIGKINGIATANIGKVNGI